MVRVVAVAMGVVLCLTGGVAQAAPKRANLVVTTLSDAPALLAGAKLTTTATVRNRGRARAKRSRVALLLSGDGRRSKDDLKLAVVKVRKLGRRKTARVRFSTSLPAMARAGMRFLACADDARKVRESRESDNCRVAKRPLEILAPPGGGPAPQPTPGPTPAASPAPPNLRVSPQLDTGSAVTQPIGVGGGTIEATGADGSHYKLEIPADALLSEATITMTPLTGVGGAAMSGTVAGVDLQPHGLRLAKAATLTVTPHAPIPISDQMGFGYTGDGNDFHYAPLLADNTKIALSLQHFSGHGAGATTPQDRERQAQAQYEFPGQEAAHNRMGPLMQKWKETGTFPKEEFIAELRRWYEESVKPNLLAAQTSEDKVYPALKEWLAWGKDMAVLNLGDTLHPDLAQPLGREASAAVGSARKVLINAYKRARDACLIDHEVEAAPRMLQYDRDMYLLFNEGGGSLEEVRNCLRFEVDFTVQYTEYGSDWSKTVAAQALAVPARMDSNVSWQIAEKSLTFTTYARSGYVNENEEQCDYTLVDVVEKEPFQFRSLELDLNYSDDSPTARADRVKLHFRIGKGTARHEDSCTQQLQQLQGWPGLWFQFHPEVGSTLQGSLLGGFSYVGSSVLARRTYDISRELVDGGQSGYTETTRFEIRHTPG